MNVYAVNVVGKPKHGEEYDYVIEVTADTLGGAKRIAESQLQKHEKIKSTYYLREAP